MSKCSQADIQAAVDDRLKQIQVSNNVVEKLGQYGLTPDSLAQKMQAINQSSGCDIACQRRRQIDNLKAKWDAAKAREEEAPAQTATAERNYYVIAKGEQGYKDMLVARYRKTAGEKSQQKLKEHRKFMDNFNVLLRDYTSEKQVLARLEELYKLRLNENKELRGAIDSDEAAVHTNDRRVVYEVRAQDWLQTVNKALFVLYILGVIGILVMGSFIKDSGYKTVRGWLVVAGLIATPFLLRPLALGLIYLTAWIASFARRDAPRNVYV